MSKIYKLMMCLALIFLCTLPAFATEEVPEVSDEEVVEDVQVVEEVSQTIEYNFELREPIKVFPITEEEYLKGSSDSAMFVSGSAYEGAFNSTALNYFTGIMLNNVGSDYVAFRHSQYVYYLFWGNDISYSNNVFSGSDLNYINYSTYDGAFSRGVDDLTLNHNNAVVYSNVNENFANLLEVKNVEEIRAQSIVNASVFVLIVLLWFFKR